MISNWQKVKLEEIVETINTGLDAIRRAPIVSYPTQIKCLRIQDISQNKPISEWGFTNVKDSDYVNYRLRKGEIIMARTCSTGINYLVKEDLNAVFNNGLARLRVKKSRVNENFLFYIFRSSSFINYINGISCGTSVQLNMKVGDLSNYQFQLPPIIEQNIISKILGTLDEKIDLNKKTNETFEEIAKALFKSWFIDFDPVKAKLEGRSTGLPDEISDLFPDSFEESEYGTIPKGWRTTNLSEIASLNPESWSSKDHPKNIEYLDLSGVKNGIILESNTYLWSNAPSRAKRILHIGDTIIGTVRPGNRSFCMIQREGLTGSTGFAALRPKNQINAPLLYLVTTSKENIQRLSRLADGGAYPAVKPEVIIESSLVLPTISIQKIFHKLLSPIFCKIFENKMESDHLSKIRNTLLPKLISGEIRIPDAEKMIEEAEI